MIKNIFLVVNCDNFHGFGAWGRFLLIDLLTICCGSLILVSMMVACTLVLCHLILIYLKVTMNPRFLYPVLTVRGTWLIILPVSTVIFYIIFGASVTYEFYLVFLGVINARCGLRLWDYLLTTGSLLITALNTRSSVAWIFVASFGYSLHTVIELSYLTRNQL